MPTAIAHAAAALAVGSAFPRDAVPRWAWVVGCCCAVAPDLDTIAFRFGIPYSHMFGHRGFFHSLAFAVLLSFAASFATSRLSRRRGSGSSLAVYLLIVTTSHGLLDTLTDGGLGIALLSPFSNHRYFAPVQPIVVSPIGVRGLFSECGLRVVFSELLWIGIPCLVLVLVSALCRSRSSGPTSSNTTAARPVPCPPTKRGFTATPGPSPSISHSTLPPGARSPRREPRGDPKRT